MRSSIPDETMQSLGHAFILFSLSLFKKIKTKQEGKNG
jgi:hypothetical protein